MGAGFTSPGPDRRRDADRSPPYTPPSFMSAATPEPTRAEHLVATFYEFFPVADPEALRDWLQRRGSEARVRGTVLVAGEGLNGTLSGEAGPLEGLILDLKKHCGIELRQLKWSWSPSAPFRRFRIRVKPELVTFKQTDANPLRATGTHLGPREWDEVIARPDVRLIDTRNDYETAIGGFVDAEDPSTGNFTDFAAYVDEHLDPERDREIAMYCTGGIRCEKASSLLLARGFDKVYHLDGGILRYLEETTPENSRWQGECYVFDERVSVGHDLEPGRYRNCAGCGWPTENGVRCPRCGAADATPSPQPTD